MTNKERTCAQSLSKLKYFDHGKQGGKKKTFILYGHPANQVTEVFLLWWQEWRG